MFLLLPQKDVQQPASLRDLASQNQVLLKRSHKFASSRTIALLVRTEKCKAISFCEVEGVLPDRCPGRQCESLSAVTCGREERQIVCRVWNLRRDTWMERESMSVGCVGRRRRHGGPPWLRVACEVGRRSDFRGRLVSCPGPSPGQLGGNHGLQVGGLWVVVDGPERRCHRALH